jgi:hypothetical protein
MTQRNGLSALGFLFLLAGSLLIQSRLWAQSGATLLVTTDLDCSWTLDGHPLGSLTAGGYARIPVSLGKHYIHATANYRQAVYDTSVTASQEEETKVEIKLKRTDPLQDSMWTDSQTRLMWARESSLGDMTRQQASDYCKYSSLGSYSNWRLPTIEELALIHNRSHGVNGCHITGDIQFHDACRAWSSSKGNAEGEAWTFGFDQEEPSPQERARTPRFFREHEWQRSSRPFGKSDLIRALCVRYTGN